jgi:hypothetical protein
MTQRRLRNRELHRSPSEATQFGDVDKVIQLFEIHRDSRDIYF